MEQVSFRETVFRGSKIFYCIPNCFVSELTEILSNEADNSCTGIPEDILGAVKNIGMRVFLVFHWES